MNRKEKQALAICYSKRRRITSDDLSKVFKTEQVRRNNLRYFHDNGYLRRNMDDGFLEINPDHLPEIIKVLSE